MAPGQGEFNGEDGGVWDCWGGFGGGRGELDGEAGWRVWGSQGGFGGGRGSILEGGGAGWWTGSDRLSGKAPEN
jgi:hypothetical protein